MRYFLFFLSLSLSLWAFAQMPPDSLPVLRIGIKAVPPFVNLEGDEPSGLSIDFWELVNEQPNYRYHYRVYDRLGDLIEAIETGAVDLSINPLTVSEKRMQSMVFSQPFIISGTTFVQKSQSQWLTFLGNFFTWQFLSVLAILLGINLLIGLVIWFIEKRANPEEFRKGLAGIGDGVWWSAVTMTTVGYGDKAPKTAAGKVVGFVWMFAALLMISGLTAGIASALTVSTLDDSIESVQDLQKFKTGTVKSSSTYAFLKSHQVQAQSFRTVKEGLEALESGAIEVLVYDRPILEYYRQNLGYTELTLASRNLKTDYYGFAFPKNSTLRNKRDPQIVRALKSNVWKSRP